MIDKSNQNLPTELTVEMEQSIWRGGPRSSNNLNLHPSILSVARWVMSSKMTTRAFLIKAGTTGRSIRGSTSTPLSTHASKSRRDEYRIFLSPLCRRGSLPVPASRSHLLRKTTKDCVWLLSIDKTRVYCSLGRSCLLPRTLRRSRNFG